MIEFIVGQRVKFCTPWGSSGTGTIRGFKNGRARVDPDQDAIKGRDYWPRPLDGPYWGPRYHGVPLRFLSRIEDGRANSIATEERAEARVSNADAWISRWINMLD